MRPTSPWASVALIYLLALCQAHAEISERFARNSSRDVKVPRALVHRLDTEYREYLNKQGFPPTQEIKRKFLNIAALLTQSRTVALHEDTRILTPLGGGVVDLSEYVTPLRGAFSLKVLPKREDDKEATGLRVFFISKAKSRKVDGEEFGAGCGKYMEITSFLKQRNLHSGFDLYTAEQRYLSVIGGTFVAVDFEPDALHVGSLTLLDSRYPDLMCE